MNVVAATRAYEDWLGGQLELVLKDLDRKHKRMQESPFVFLDYPGFDGDLVIRFPLSRN